MRVNWVRMWDYSRLFGKMKDNAEGVRPPPNEGGAWGALAVWVLKI